MFLNLAESIRDINAHNIALGHESLHETKQL